MYVCMYVMHGKLISGLRKLLAMALLSAQSCSLSDHVWNDYTTEVDT